MTHARLIPPQFVHMDAVAISPLPRVPVEIWIGGTVPASARRAGRLGDGWLTGQNASDDEAVDQLRAYRDAADSHGRPI